MFSDFERLLRTSQLAERFATGSTRRSAFRRTRVLLGGAIAAGVSPEELAGLLGVTANSVRSRLETQGELSEQEFLQVCDISVSTMERWRQEGLITSSVTDIRGRRYYPASALVAAVLDAPEI